MNVKIGDKKTFDDWGLKLKSISVGLPEVKENPVDIPGADGMIDLTETLGGVRYYNRQLSLVFDVPGRPEEWHETVSRISNYLHGRRMKLVLDSDPSYYYIGRLSLSSEKSSYLINQITLTGDMEPYKYELLSSLDRWPWDPFSFQSGIIRNYKELKVNGSLKVTISGTRKEVIPTIISNAVMQAEWKGIRYSIPVGKSKIFAISLPEGENVLTFYGQGIVSIDYRGGIL